MKKKTIKYALGIIITALAIWLSFRNLDWETLKTSFTQVDPVWVLLAGINVLISVYIMGWRWQGLLRSKVDIPLWDFFRFNIISQYLNIIIPARFGEFLKAWLVSRKYSLSGSYALGTILVEKLVESFIIVMLGVLAPLFITFRENLKGYTVAVAIFVVLIPLVVLVIRKRRQIRKILAWFARVFPQRFRQRILDSMDRGMEAFALLKDAKLTLRTAAITLLMLLSQVITNLLLFQAFGFTLSFIEALILQLVLIVGMSIPSVPGKIGVFEYTVVLALSMFNIDRGAALSYGLLLHVIAYIPKIVMGFLFMANLNISLKTTETELGIFKGQVQAKTEPGRKSENNNSTGENNGKDTVTT